MCARGKGSHEGRLTIRIGCEGRSCRDPNRLSRYKILDSKETLVPSNNRPDHGVAYCKGATKGILVDRAVVRDGEEKLDCRRARIGVEIAVFRQKPNYHS